jgi:hypothetical protein
MGGRKVGILEEWISGIREIWKDGIVVRWNFGRKE